ncbi:MAG: cytochrome C oxidase subunit IV family protein [Candidatus Omnitrophica bacterium]|nr:cytochrome C oxidase subunit IV family protein [Candidatus Omnitrophota bacterium]
MHETKSNVGLASYIWVFAGLIFLTALEVLAVSADFSKTAVLLFLLGTVAAKALLIALFFMHLKSEKWWVWLLPALPVLLSILFIFALFPDIVYHAAQTFEHRI